MPLTIMSRVIHVRNDVWTPYELRTQIFRVNVVSNTDHSGDPKKILFSSKKNLPAKIVFSRFD